MRRLAPDHLTSGTRPAPRVASPTSVRSEVIRFLTRAPGTWFCDGCVALDVKVSLDEARAVMEELEADRRVHRGEGECSRCGRSLTAARVERPSAA